MTDQLTPKQRKAVTAITCATMAGSSDWPTTLRRAGVSQQAYDQWAREGPAFEVALKESLQDAGEVAVTMLISLLDKHLHPQLDSLWHFLHDDNLRLSTRFRAGKALSAEWDYFEEAFKDLDDAMEDVTRQLDEAGEATV